MPNMISMMGQQYIFLFQVNKTNQTEIEQDTVFLIIQQTNINNLYQHSVSAQATYSSTS